MNSCRCRFTSLFLDGASHRLRLPLLADAEAAEDAVEEVVGVDGADDVGEFGEGVAEFESEEVLVGGVRREFEGAVEGLLGAGEAVVAAGCGRADPDRGGGGGSVECGGDPVTEGR